MPGNLEFGCTNRAAALIALVGLLSGCDGADLRACEDYTKATLNTPATYHRASVEVFEQNKLSLEQWFSLTGKTPATTLAPKLVQEGQAEAGLGLRQVFIHYDADNAYGTPVRGLTACGFKLVGGKLVDEKQLTSYADTYATNENLKRAGALPPELENKLKYPCCLNPYD